MKKQEIGRYGYVADRRELILEHLRGSGVSTIKDIYSDLIRQGVVTSYASTVDDLRFMVRQNLIETVVRGAYRIKGGEEKGGGHG